MKFLKTIYKEKSLIAEINSSAKPGNINLNNFVKLHGQFIEEFTAQEVVKKKRVMVIGGGMSAEREVSYVSSNGIVRSIIELGHHVIFVDMGADIALVLTKLKPDVVYNALHGTYGEDGCLSGLLNIMQIPYTSSGLLASAIAFNKWESYKIFKSAEIPIPKGKLIKKADQYIHDPLDRPYVIKPLSEGSSIGVEVILPEDEFSFADYDFPYGDEVIVEEYIKGREMQITVLDGKALGVLEMILLKGQRFNDYNTKYVEGFAKHLLPAPIEEALTDKIKDLAERAYRVFNCSGMIRAEVICSFADNKPYMIEINTHPGMTALSTAPEIANWAGISYRDLVKRILDKAKFE